LAERSAADAPSLSVYIQRRFYRNGQMQETVPIHGGRRHGIVRTWHRKIGSPRCAGCSVAEIGSGYETGRSFPNGSISTASQSVLPRIEEP
jgi:hypothetical protein